MERELRIVVTGLAGSGKSATINSILGRRAFKSIASATRVTEKCEFVQETIDNKAILLVDTPALYDTAASEEENLRELAKIIGITAPGFHTIIFVTRIGRFTQQEISAFEDLSKCFGNEMYKRAIILFTGLDELKQEGIQFKEYVEIHISKALKGIITKCGGRVVGFDNRGDERQRQYQVKQLMKTIDDIVRMVHGTYVSSKIYKEATLIISDRMEREAETTVREKREEIQHERGDYGKLVSIVQHYREQPTSCWQILMQWLMGFQ